MEGHLYPLAQTQAVTCLYCLWLTIYSCGLCMNCVWAHVGLVLSIWDSEKSIIYATYKFKINLWLTS